MHKLSYPPLSYHDVHLSKIWNHDVTTGENAKNCHHTRKKHSLFSAKPWFMYIIDLKIKTKDFKKKRMDFSNLSKISSNHGVVSQWGLCNCTRFTKFWIVSQKLELKQKTKLNWFWIEVLQKLRCFGSKFNFNFSTKFNMKANVVPGSWMFDFLKMLIICFRNFLCLYKFSDNPKFFIRFFLFGFSQSLDTLYNDKICSGVNTISPLYRSNWNFFQYF